MHSSKEFASIVQVAFGCDVPRAYNSLAMAYEWLSSHENDVRSFDQAAAVHNLQEQLAGLLNAISSSAEAFGVKPIMERSGKEWLFRLNDFHDIERETITENLVDKLRTEFPIGCEVVLDKMDDEQAPPVGTIGRVIGVDDIGTIHVQWSNGSSLGVAFGVDRCHRI